MPEEPKKKKKFSISSLFFEEDEEKKEDQAEPPIEPKTKTVEAVRTPAADTTGVFDKRVYDSLIKALEKNNQQGFDYFEFKNSLEALKDVITDEATRYKSAYATATTMNVNINTLIESAQFYLKVLGDEKKNFSETLKVNQDEKVEQKTKEVKDIDNFIKKKSEEIAKLTNEINALQSDKVKISNSIAENKIKIEATKNNFESTYEQLTGKINQDITKMKSYLK